MGLFFRKSTKVGPFRINYSKSGIGVSTGVKGARVSVGPRGTYVNVGRNGVYYRKKVGGRKAKKNNKATYVRSNLSADYNYDNLIDDSIRAIGQVDAVNVHHNEGLESDFGKSLISGVRRANIVFWLWIAVFLISVYYISDWAIPILIATRIIGFPLFRKKVTYNLDEEAGLEWGRFAEAVNILKTSKKNWIIKTSRHVYGAREYLGDVREITKKEAKVKYVKASRKIGIRLKSNVDAVYIKSGRIKIVFLPTDVIIVEGHRIAVCSYENIEIKATTSNILENTTAIPSGVELMGFKWRHETVDGLADLRYKDNPSRPICKYGAIVFSKGNDIKIEVLSSEIGVVENFGRAYKHYKSYISALFNDRHDAGAELDSDAHSSVKTIDTVSLVQDGFVSNEDYDDHIRNALKEYTIKQNNTNNVSDSFDNQSSLSEIAKEGTTLFSDEPSSEQNDDGYKELLAFVDEKEKKAEPTLEEDIMGFFEKEE